MATFETALSIISDVAVEVGLSSVSVAYASTNADVILLRTLLKSVGRDLVSRHEWLSCVKEHTFTTTSATSYNLPTDFLSMIHQSGWNRTERMRLEPASSQEWQYLNASTSSATFTAIFKPHATTLELWPQPPTSGDSIAFEYRSSYWVAVTSSTTPTKNAPTLDTDVVCLDSQLVTRALKLAFLRARGFDTSAAADEFNVALESYKSANAVGSPVLSLNGGRMTERFLDMNNVGTTGFGFDDAGGLF